MEKSMMKKIVCSVVASLFLINNVAYGLSPMPGSRNPETQGDMYALGRELLNGKIGPGAIDLDATTPEFTGAEFVGNELLGHPDVGVYIYEANGYGTKFVKADYGNPPEAWKNNPILKETDLVSAFKAFRDTQARIPAENLDIKEGYFPVDEAKGELPIARIEKVGEDKYVLVIHTRFVQMWNHIRKNDVWFEANLGPYDRRTMSVAWGIFYRLAKHELADLKQEGFLPKSVGHISYDVFQETIDINREEVLANMIGGRYQFLNDSIWLWFLASYAFRNTTRYNNGTFLKRAHWIFESEEAKEMNLNTEFPKLLAPFATADDRTLAIAFAYAINYNFFSRPGMAIPEEHLIDPRHLAEYKERENARKSAGITEEPIYSTRPEEQAEETARLSAKTLKKDPALRTPYTIDTRTGKYFRAKGFLGVYPKAQIYDYGYTGEVFIRFYYRASYDTAEDYASADARELIKLLKKAHPQWKANEWRPEIRYPSVQDWMWEIAITTKSMQATGGKPFGANKGPGASEDNPILEEMTTCLHGGMELIEQNKLIEAEQKFLRALDLLDKTQQSHLLTGIDLHAQLGALLYTQERYSEAEVHFRNALNLSQAVPSLADSAATFPIISDLIDLIAQNKMSEAAKVIRESRAALASAEKIFEEIGIDLVVQGKYPEALKAFSNAYEISRRLLYQASISNTPQDEKAKMFSESAFIAAKSRTVLFSYLQIHLNDASSKLSSVLAEVKKIKETTLIDEFERVMGESFQSLQAVIEAAVDREKNILPPLDFGAEKIWTHFSQITRSVGILLATLSDVKTDEAKRLLEELTSKAADFILAMETMRECAVIMGPQCKIIGEDKILSVISELRDEAMVEGVTAKQIAIRLNIDDVGIFEPVLRHLVDDGVLISVVRPVALNTQELDGIIKYAQDSGVDENMRIEISNEFNRKHGGEIFLLNASEVAKRPFSREKARTIVSNPAQLKQFATALCWLFGDRFNPTLYTVISESLTLIGKGSRKINGLAQRLDELITTTKKDDLFGKVTDAAWDENFQLKPEIARRFIMSSSARLQYMLRLVEDMDEASTKQPETYQKRLKMAHAHLASVADVYSALTEAITSSTTEKPTETMPATGGRQSNTNEGQGSESVKESTKDEATQHPLIAVISEFVVPLGRNTGPGSIKLSRNETQNIWQVVNLLNDNQIEILLPQQVKLTETMKKALSDIRKRKGADAVKTEEYSSVEHLEKLLGQKTAPGLRRIVLTEKGMSSQMKQLAESNPELFNGNRLLNIDLPDNYTNMSAKEKMFYQARMVMTAILARLYEKDGTPMVEMILTNMLTGCVDVEDGDIGKFLNRLAESDNESSNPNQVKERILYCLGKTVSLITKLAEAMEHVRLIMKEFWTAA